MIQKLNKVISPLGFKTYTTNAGIKDGSLDLLVVFSQTPCVATGVFTKSIFPSPAVSLSRSHLKSQLAQALVVKSKNANVGNGKLGVKNTNSIAHKVACELNLPIQAIQMGATGVIGQPLLVDKVLNCLDHLESKLKGANFLEAAQAIMTTDQYPKALSYRIGNTVLTGIVKGVGMIEPNMATLLLYFFTDAKIKHSELQSLFKRVMDQTFNCISIDHDMSTSDSALIMANGMGEAVDIEMFEQALRALSIDLLKMVLLDGEGATKLICLSVKQAKNMQQAKQVGKSIINSMLVKTAIYGADPNWGRIIMAIGKCIDHPDIALERLQIKIAGFSVYPNNPQNFLDTQMLSDLSNKMRANQQIDIVITLNTGDSACDLWGCDLSEAYVRFNSHYTT